MIDFQAVGEVAYSCSTFIRMRDYYDFVSSIDEFLVDRQDRTGKREVGSWTARVHTDDSW